MNSIVDMGFECTTMMKLALVGDQGSEDFVDAQTVGMRPYILMGKFALS